jgi:hypothetical protein
LAEDLYNPHIGKEFLDNPCIAIESNFILIDMGGGDGSAAYRARFVINLENLVARRELYQFPSIEKAQISEGKMDREIGDER